MGDFIVSDDFPDYKYYNGESENPYCGQDENPLDFSNPKALFWHYEKHFDEWENEQKDYNEFISNLINNKLSEYHRNEKELWEMYHHHSIKK